MLFKLFAYPRPSVPKDPAECEQVRVSQKAMGYETQGPVRDIDANDLGSAKELFLDLHWPDGAALGCYSGAWSVQLLNE